jgi:hypothetical protein
MIFGSLVPTGPGDPMRFLSGRTLLFALLILAPKPAHAIDTAAADTAYAHQDWPAAEKGYAAIVKTDPSLPRAWYRLGVARSSQGKWAASIEAYRRADAFGVIPPAFARYNLACAFARAGERDSAFATLDRLVAAGYRQPDQLQGDADLASVRSDPRFDGVLAHAKANMEPCASVPESRQFDFWVGDWNVTSNRNAGAFAGKSHVERILGQCVIFENWTAPGGSGKSFNAWNSERACWQQNWMDDTGDVTNYTDGHFTDGAMRFHTEKKDASGAWKKHRLTFFPVSTDEVRQLGEHEGDGGNWVVDYDLEYHRVK